MWTVGRAHRGGCDCRVFAVCVVGPTAEAVVDADEPVDDDYGAYGHDYEGYVGVEEQVDPVVHVHVKGEVGLELIQRFKNTLHKVRNHT